MLSTPDWCLWCNNVQFPNYILTSLLDVGKALPNYFSGIREANKIN